MNNAFIHTAPSRRALMEEAYQSLLLDYASGALDEARALIVAAHLSLSPQGREIVAAYERIGGALLQDCCECVEMAEGALEDIFSRLDALENTARDMPASALPQHKSSAQPSRHPCAQAQNLMPRCLHHYLPSHRGDTLPWKKMQKGLYALGLPTGCRQTELALFRVEAGAPLPARTPRTPQGYEITLILEGAVHDEEHFYRRGDLLVIDECFRLQAPRPDGEQGCICLVLHAAPSANSLKNWLNRLRAVFRH